MSISGISQPEYSSELIRGELSDISNLQLWGHSAHLQLDHLDFICYDWGFIAFIKGSIEHLNGICMKLIGKAGPFEGERHWRW